MRTLFIFLFCALLQQQANAQSKKTTLHGTVIAEHSQIPLAGTTVQLNGITKTRTDSLGRFIIEVNFPASLLFEHTGFKKRLLLINHDAADTLQIVLAEEMSQLDNVTVSTGYLTIPKERATGSFVQLSEKDLGLQPSQNIIDRLVNITSGLSTDQAAGRPPLTIRGLSTINGPKDPLIVVDNFVYAGDINSINPLDVESVSVLKDAAAASVWGARAGNGVIVITTKKARLGRPLTVSLNSNFSVQSKPDLFYTPQISSSDFIDVEQMLFAKGYYNAQENNTARPALSPVVETLIAVRDGKITQQNGDALITSLRNIDVRQQYSDEVYKNQTLQQHFLSLQSGAQNFATFFSLGYDQRLSSLSAMDERITLRSDNTFRPFSKTEMSFKLAYTSDRSTSGNNGLGSIRINTSQSLYPYSDLSGPIDMFRRPYIDTAGAGKLLNWKYDALQEAALNPSVMNLDNLTMGTTLSFEPIKGFKISGLLQQELQNVRNETIHQSESYYTRSTINRFSQIDKATGKVIYAVPRGAIKNSAREKLSALSARFQLNYDQSFGDHAINLLTGAESRNAQTTGDASLVYGFNENNLTYAPVDHVNTYPTYITGSKQQIPAETNLSELNNRFVSFYFNGAYTYKKRYSFSASARKDASNIFGLQTNDKWEPLWSVGGAWKISGESFFDSDLIGSLKLRTTYGYSGNVDNSRSAVPVLSYSSGASVTGFPFAQIRQFANPSLRWEKIATFNAGLDMSFKSVDVTLEYYRRKATDLYGNASVDLTAGVGDRIVKNIADLLTTGIDLTADISVVRKTKFAWNTSLLASYNRDKVLRNNIPNPAVPLFTNGGIGVSALEGLPVFALFAYPFAGLDPTNGNPLGYVAGQSSQDYATLTGSKTTVYDLNYVGRVTPSFFGSWRNEFSYRNFSLSIMIAYKAGYWFRRSSIHYSSFFAGSLGHSDYSLRWQKPGDELTTTIPSLIYPTTAARDNFYASAMPNMERADHVRVKFIRLSYRHAFTKKMLPKNLQCFLHIADPGIVWTKNKKGIDPDHLSGFPNPANFTFGIQLNY
jgi:TonB-linked SusC/RagA family outer membrane protein